MTTLPPRWFPLRAHPIQQAYAATILPQSPYRFIALPCGRRSGKTELSRRRLVMSLAIDRGYGPIVHEYLACAPTRDQALKLWWPHLKELIPPEWVTSRNESRLEIVTNVAGVRAKITVAGLEKAMRCEGSAYDGIIIDESSDIKDDALVSLMATLADRKGWMIRQGIPKRFGCGAVSYREFCQQGFAREPGHISFTWPSWDILTPEEIEVQKRFYTEPDFIEQFGGVWQDGNAGAFHAFDESVHVRECHYQPDKPILVGADWNVNPLGWALCHSPDGKTVEVFDEHWLTNTYTQEALDKLWDRYSSHKGGWFFYGDATSKARHTSASSSDYAQILNDKRFKARVEIPHNNPGVKDRLTSANLLLRNAAGEVRCWVDPKCHHLIADLKKRLLDDKGNLAEGIPGNPIGHISDGWSYLVHRRHPSTQLTGGKSEVHIDFGN